MKVLKQMIYDDIDTDGVFHMCELANDISVHFPF